jgi:hypothetical protein
MNHKINQLNSLALLGLKEMFDDDKNRFHFRIKKSNHGLIKEGFSLRYTIISLLGLHKIKMHGFESPIDIESIIEDIITRSYEIDNIGDLGLLMWLCALAKPQKIKQIFEIFKIEHALNTYKDARQLCTMELSWFLAGLAHIAISTENADQRVTKLMSKVFQLLRKNYGGKGIFRHNGRNSLVGLIRGRIGSFADQVYPIYAFSKYYQACGNKVAIDIALESAETICKLQGHLGQWWWHYDSATSKVIGRYPVYAVHQDGMAPMALFALRDVSGIDFTAYIFKGLDWIFGDNEICVNLISCQQDLIWRSIYRNKYKTYLDEILSLVKYNSNEKRYKNLIILTECRPYHLGWLLYAFADNLSNFLDI